MRHRHTRRHGQLRPSLIHPLEPRRLLSAAAAAGTVPLRVNAGGGDWYTDSLARTFRPDAGFTGGASVTSPAYDVQNTTDDPLFLSYHAGPAFTFSAPVPAGHYALWLEFAEPDPAATPGQRVFSVRAEGATALTDFDVTLAAGGPQRAVAECVDLTVTDGTLDLSFTASAGDAIVSAISLVPTDPPAEAAPYSWLALSDAARVTVDASHLRELGQMAFFYAADHRGSLPPDLAGGDFPSVAPDTYISPRTSSALPRGTLSPVERAGWIATRDDYVYRGAGQRSNLPANYVLAYDNPDRVPGSINVLFGDGHVATLSRADAASLIGFPDVPPTDPPTAPPPLPPADPKVVRSASNLHQIANDLLLYSNEQKGRYPATLGDLVPYFGLPASLFLNPRSTTAAPADFSAWSDADQTAWVNAHADYAYLGAGKRGNTLGGTDPLIYEKSDGMTGGVNVLFGDGQVRFLEFPYADETLAPVTAPAVRDASFSASPSAQSLSFRFTEDVSLSPAALTLTDSSGNPVPGPVTLTYDHATHTATFTFPRLATGRYHATLSSAAIADTAGVHPAADVPFEFAYVAAGTRLTLPAGQTVKLQDLSIDPGGTLDLSDASLILDSFNTPPTASLRAWLAAGRNGGTWDGTGGIVTTSPALGTYRAIGYADAATLALSAYAGQSVDAAALLLKYTFIGDANLDGAITADDYALTDRGMPKGLDTWVGGDFDYDGAVTADDYALLNRSYAATRAVPPSAVVPAAAQPATSGVTIPSAAPHASAKSAPRRKPKTPKPPAHRKAKLKHVSAVKMLFLHCSKLLRPR